MPNKGKKILILGNGFDLAHGLPTKYSHFLEFCQRFETMWGLCSGIEKQTVLNNETTSDNRLIDKNLIHSFFPEKFHNIKVMLKKGGGIEVVSDNLELSEIHNLLDDNVWYKYFTELYNTNSMKGENWIDFESEIRFIIKVLDEHSLSLSELWSNVMQAAIVSLNEHKLRIFQTKLSFIKYLKQNRLSSDYTPTVKDVREKAFKDLERLTRALELYLVEFVERIPISDSDKIPEISNLSPDYVINFNYTDTYERIYKKGKVYHIHGKADAEHSAEENNMVLGIDEYWLGDERDKRTNFTIFKKFAQRIQKHTGNESYKYLEEIQKIFKEKGNMWSGNGDVSKDHPDGVSYVYVFGHSLDVTDKDILSSFIGDDSTSVIVYCMDKGTEGELIANTIKLISEEKLLEKSNHLPTKLEYVIPKKTDKP